MSNFTETLYVDNINNEKTIDFILKYSPDLIICFGTRKIEKVIFHNREDIFLNLHGGNPEEYRGLDSHYWAIWHNDFFELKTCLHKINYILDDGELVEIKSLELNEIKKIEELRSINTDCCVKLVLNAISSFIKYEKIHSVKQTKVGRYYSAMPSVLKDRVVINFQKYLGTVGGE